MPFKLVQLVGALALVGLAPLLLQVVGCGGGALLSSARLLAEPRAQVSTQAPEAQRTLALDMDSVEFRYLSHAIIDEKHKLLICAIPKVPSAEDPSSACTSPYLALTRRPLPRTRSSLSSPPIFSAWSW